MQLKYDSRIEGEFEGWNGDRVFELTNGSKWQQKRHKYKYRYKYRPKAKIWQDGSTHYLEVDCMNENIEVRRVY